MAEDGPRHRRSGPPRRAAIALVGVAVGIVLLLGAVAWAGQGAPAAQVGPSAVTGPFGDLAAPAAPPTALGTWPDPSPAPAPADGVAAAAVRIPALAVASPIVPLALAPDRVLEPPVDPDVVGWYVGSAVPGRRGPAVMTGHIDSRDGPGVFARLAEVPDGSTIEVDLSDGSTVRFRVVSVVRSGKGEFPTDAVYGPVPVPVLRVISCTGRFDRASRHYVDNVIVTAVPV